MKEFKFEITITDYDLAGVYSWEEALEVDGTGITELTKALVLMIQDSNLMPSFSPSDNKAKDIIKLISYKDIKQCIF